MSNILLINSQDYDDDDLIAGNVIVDNEGKTQEIIINVQDSERGARGIGIPEGGTPGQVMVKQSLEDFNVAWTNLNIPTRTSDLINDTDFVSDDHYVHTDNNFTTPEKEKLDNLANITAIGDNLTLTNGRLDASGGGGVTSVNEKTGDVVLDAEDVGAVATNLGIANANKNLITDASGNIITSDYSLGQIIVEYYTDLPTNVPEGAQGTVQKSMVVNVNPTLTDVDDMFYSVKPVESPTLYEDYVDVNFNNAFFSITSDYSDDSFFMLSYQVNDQEDFYLYGENQTTWNEQTINVGWNHVTIDEQTGDYVVTSIIYADLPYASNSILESWTDDFQDFDPRNNVIFEQLKTKGEYHYQSIPETSPTQYQWVYIESAVQSDWQQTDDTELDFIKNKPLVFGKSNNSIRLISDSSSTSGGYSIAGGRNNEATGTDSIALGNNASASATSSFAIGSSSSASGNYSGSLGDRNTVTGTNNYVLGAYNSITASGSAGSSVVGQGNTCANSNAVLLGQYLTSGKGMQTVVGTFNVADSTNQFVVGVGANGSNQKNGLTIDSSGNAWMQTLKTGGTGYSTGYNVLNTNDIINNVTSTATSQPLSANMGKELQDQITNLQSRGRFLSLWDCSTGLATTEPTVNPYTYKTGDYFIVSVADNAKWYYPYTPDDVYMIGDKCSYNGGYYICNTNNTTGNWNASRWDAHTIINYRPTGSTYDKNVPSTAIETRSVDVNDVYYYDGTHWALQVNNQAEVTFGSIAGDPMDNAGLEIAFNSKQNVSNLVTQITPLSTNSQYPSAKCVYDLIGNVESILHTLNSGGGAS